MSETKGLLITRVVNPRIGPPQRRSASLLWQNPIETHHRSATDRIGLGVVYELRRTRLAIRHYAARCVIYFVYVSVVSPSSPCRATEIVQARSCSVVFGVACVRPYTFSCEAVKSEFRKRYSTDIQNARTLPQFSFEIEKSE
ncbi:hypothetical protein ALC62_00646 [Cyphomyrmex costatus]|uniref:Uncharacterized protein n=1 Tax=Cyphomyrmex costatus TaxID=456900 RepID=A0A151IQC7_9HYME|nr:hypothetical protein ALC62_00646 [Cyphomyrmex costatus]